MYDHLTDRELLDVYQEGKMEAFEEIYKRYWEMLYHHALRMVKDKELARDAVQEVFVMLLTQAGKLDRVLSIRGYLSRCMMNRILNQIKSSKVKQDYINRLQKYSIADFDFTEEEVVRKRKDQERILEERIATEISQLPPKMRTVFELSYGAQLSHKEIARKTGTSQHTIKKQVHSALRIIRSKLLF